MTYTHIQLARLHGAKLVRRRNGRWQCDEMAGTSLDRLSFGSIQNAARAYLIYNQVDPHETARHYIDGFKTGRQWTDSYRPGGPCVFSVNEQHGKPSFKIHCRKMAAAHTEWLRGFDAGFAKRGKQAA